MVAFRILPAAADFPRQAFMSPHIGEREKKKSILRAFSCDATL